MTREKANCIDIMSAFGATEDFRRNFMTLSLTSQEKKVLGFILLMVALGLVMLGVRKCLPPKAETNPSSLSVLPTAAPTTP